MRNRLFYVVVFSLTLILTCCSSEQQEQKEVLAKINDFQLSLEEFEYQLAAELEMEKDFKLTREAKKEFLEQLIRKELLIQEARRMKLDRREDFVRTIERYWESTLIRDLMDLKGKELSKRTNATEEEVLALYERAQEILQMRGKLKRVFINLYPGREALGQAYYGLTRRQCRIRAWYIHRLKTIYINVEDVHEGMLAHEMAHSIIDHYLMVPPLCKRGNPCTLC